MILISIANVTGDSKLIGFEKYFTATSFSFNIGRELAESGGKGGTQDMHIGVAEMQEISMEKSSDAATIPLCKWAIAGTRIPSPVLIRFVATGTDQKGEGLHINFMSVVLDRVFVKTWSISGSEDGRPTESLTFFFQYFAVKYAQVKGDEAAGNTLLDHRGSWDHVKNTPWDAGYSMVPELKAVKAAESTD